MAIVKSEKCWISLVYVHRKPRADESKVGFGQMYTEKNV